MGYELHIERSGDFLSFDDWTDAVATLEGVRLSTEPLVENDPVTGNPRTWQPPPGTAEMEFGDQWIPVFYWQGGSVTFRLGNEPERVLAVALALSRELQSAVVGDEGETYSSVEDLTPPEFR